MLILDILVIGAGMSGLIAATELQKSGFKVACVEKARGSGGRLSSKRIKSEKTGEMISFDLGCPSFDAQTGLFKAHVESWLSLGVAKVWHDSETEGVQYLATPRSSSITRYLADQLDVHFSTRITEVRKEKGQWLIYTGELDHRVFFAQAKHIVFATPPQQAADLLPENHPFIAALSQPILLPQWVLMLNVKGSLGLNHDDYTFTDSIISRLSLEAGKPDRNETKTHQVWVLQANTTWTEVNLETDKVKLEHELIAELATITGLPINVDDAYLHRWLYSVAQMNGLSGKLFLNDANGIWLCGDYLADSQTLSGVEAAFVSAHELVKNFQL